MTTGARANSSPAVAAHAEGEEIEVLESGEPETGTQPDTVSHINTSHEHLINTCGAELVRGKS